MKIFYMGGAAIPRETVRELRGISCIDLVHAPAPKQQIACTRSFGRPVTDLEPLIEAVSEFASQAAEKLRKQDSLARALQVFMSLKTALARLVLLHPTHDVVDASG
mgnify:CR=1 FL=1